MKTRIVYASLLVLASAGCVDRTPPATTGEVAVPINKQDEAAASMQRERVELGVPTGDVNAFPIQTGSYASGALTAPRAGDIFALAIQIGNYANSAKGKVSIELCKGAVCAKGQQSLAGSVDNEYLDVPLESALKVNAGDSVSYRFTKLDGENQVALWLYPADKQRSSIKINDGTAIDRAPKIALIY